MPQLNCRYFNGYKPCGRHESCDSACPQKDLIQTRVLLIHLGAMGAVVRSTALLRAIHKKFAGCHLTWVTQSPADSLLRGHPLIDRVLTTSRDDLLALSALEFDVALSVDKSLVVAGILKLTRADQIFGFQSDAATGAIVPATNAAEELWQIGLSDKKKFFENKRPETELVANALELHDYRRDEYDLRLNAHEQAEVAKRRSIWAMPDQLIIGINTGCSPVIPYKKLSIETQREIVLKCVANGYRVVLLGGPEDTQRNQQIAFGLPLVSTPTERGLRDGLISVAACDVVVSGDSLGMHLAIAMKKWIVAWFGPTCAHEIDLYDRGVKVLSRASCSPCWKRSCQKSPMCYDLVDLNEIVEGIARGAEWLKSQTAIRARPPEHTLSFKQPS